MIFKVGEKYHNVKVRADSCFTFLLIKNLERKNGTPKGAEPIDTSQLCKFTSLFLNARRMNNILVSTSF